VNTKIFVIENKRFESFPLFATSLISLREFLNTNTKYLEGGIK